MLNNNLKSSIINNNSVINDNNNNNNNINNISMYNKFTSQTSEFWKNFEIIHTKLKKLKTSKFIQFTSLDYKLNVIHNFAYSITDFFYNEDFNMNRLKPLNFSDLKDNLKNTTVVFKQLTQNEKKIYLKERRILKLKQLEIKNKRISELQKSGSNFCIIKIKNNSLNIYKLSSLLPFDDEQILMAKICILNKLKYPPPSFFDKYFKEFDEILKEKEYVKEHPNEKNSHPLAKVKISSLDWTRLNYLQLIGENNDNNNINNEVIKENENDESKNENNENNENNNNENNNNNNENNNNINNNNNNTKEINPEEEKIFNENWEQNYENIYTEVKQKIRNEKEQEIKEKIASELKPKISNEIYKKNYQNLYNQAKNEIENELTPELNKKLNEELNYIKKKQNYLILF